MQRLSPQRLAFINGLFEIGIGLIHYLQPHSFLVAASDRPNHMLSALFLLGGTSVLIALRYRLSPWMHRLSILLAAAPLFIQSWLSLQSNSVVSAVIIAGLGLTAAAVPQLKVDQAAAPGPDLLDLVLAVIMTAVAVLALITLGRWDDPLLALIKPNGRLTALMFLTSSAALLTKRWWEKENILDVLLGRVAAATGPVMFGVASIQGADWPGAYFAAASALTILFVADLPAAQPMLMPVELGTDAFLDVERKIEAFSWGLLPAVVVLAVVGSGSDIVMMLHVSAQVLLTTLYNVAAYWLCPTLGNSEQRGKVHLVVFSVLTALLLAGKSLIATGALLVLIIPPMLATQAYGGGMARLMQGLAIAAIVLRELILIPAGGQAFLTAISRIFVESTFFLTVSQMVNRITMDQRRLVLELKWTEAKLQHAIRHLASQGTELVSQQVLLVAKNEELEKTTLALADLANHDPLTHLINRRRFQELLDEELERSAAHCSHGAMLFLDLDRFKYINDSMGHAEGDRVLQQVAQALKGVVEQAGTVARLGGDEFAVLLPDAGRARAETLAEQMLQALRRQLVKVNGEALPVRASAGIALYPEHGSKAGELLISADVAMYEAKASGRDTARLFGCGHEDDPCCPEVYWEQEVRTALAEDRFVLHYQPIVCLATGETLRYEVLLRMLSRAGQLHQPGSFLPAVERLPLMHALDRWVVRHSIMVMAERAASGSPVSLEINLSGKAFEDPELVPVVEGLLAQTGVRPEDVVFEITETAAIPDFAKARQGAERLRRLGCGFAIDDFGAGFASFSYLKHLPISYLKVDGSMVQQLCSQPQDQHLVRAIVAMARGLGIATIAEWVEDDATFRLLREMGVDMAQGFYIARPGPLPAALPPSDTQQAAG